MAFGSQPFLPDVRPHLPSVIRCRLSAATRSGAVGWRKTVARVGHVLLTRRMYAVRGGMMSSEEEGRNLLEDAVGQSEVAGEPSSLVVSALRSRERSNTAG